MSAMFAPPKTRVILSALMTSVFVMSAPVTQGCVPTSVPQESAADSKVQSKDQRVRNAQADAERAFDEAQKLRGSGSKEERQKAIEKYVEAYKYWQAADDQRGEARALYYLAVTYDGLDTADSLYKAIDYYNQSLAMYERIGDRKAQAQILFMIAAIYNDNGHRPEALKYLNQALPLAQAEDNHQLQGQILNNIGLAYKNLGEIDTAFKYYTDALAIWRAENSPTFLVQTLNNIGWVYEWRGQLTEAIQHYSGALEIARANNNRRGIAFSLQAIGMANKKMGEFEKAIESFNEVLAIRRQQDDPRQTAYALGDLADTYYDLGQFENTIEYNKKALPLFKQAGDVTGEALTLEGIGEANLKLNRYRESIDYLNQAKRLFEETANPQGLANTMVGIGRAYAALGEPQQAITYHKEALQLSRAKSNRSGEGMALTNLGKAYHDLGEYEREIQYYNEALAINRQTKSLPDEGLTLSYLMSAWRSLDRPRLAIFYGKQAVNVWQAIRGNLEGLEKASQKSFLRSKEKTYRELAELLIQEGRLQEAQQVIDLLKEEEYFDFIRRDVKVSRANARADYRPEEAKAKEKGDSVTAIGVRLDALEAKTQEATLSADEQRLHDQLAREIESAEVEFQSYLKVLASEIRKPDMSGNKVQEAIEQEGGLWADLRELGGDTVALYTVIGEDKYYVILMTPTTRVAREYTIKAAELSNKKIFDFRQAIQNTEIDPLPLARELYNILIGPIAKDLDGARSKPDQILTLMWSLDGVLRYVPISALHDGQKFMVERFRNVVYTSASKSRLKDSVREHWKGLGLGVSKAHSVPDGEFRALPAVPDELRSIIRDESAKATGVLPGRVFLDEAFTADVLKGVRQTYQLVHIASHFQFSPGDETKSYLLLGDGSLFTLGQLRTSGLIFSGVDLLSLSACNTAMGDKVANGIEVEGFGAMAQQLGAKAALASLWSVDDESTKELMREFYRLRESRKGISKAEALRQAQLALLNGSIRATQSSKRRLVVKSAEPGKTRGDKFKPNPAAPYAHPYHWAPFILIGNWK